MGRVALSKAGIVEATTWGTEVAVGALGQIVPSSIDISRENRAFLEDPGLLGSAWGNPGQIGAKASEITLNARLRYGDRIPKLLAFALGADAVTGASPYTHTMTIADRLTKFLTVAWQEVANATSTVYVSLPSAMIEETRLRWDGEAPGEASFNLVASELARDAGVNGSTQFTNLTRSDSAIPVLLTDGLFRLNAASGSTLAAGDNLKPRMIELVIRRPLTRPFLADSAVAGKISQPVEADVAEVLLNLEFVGKGAASAFASLVDEWEDRYEAATELKATLDFTGPSPNTFGFSFPRLQIVRMPPQAVPGSGRYPLRVEMRALEASTAPSGMSGITKPVRSVVVDAVSAAYIA